MSDRVAFITGGASGIGAATARALSLLGIRAAICDVNASAGQNLAEEINGRYIACDVSEYGSVCDAVAECEQTLGTPTYVHLNAGIMTVPTGADFLAIEDVSLTQYQNILGVNLDGVFHGMKALLPKLKAGEGGTITTTASTAAFGDLAIDPLYSATKHGLIGLVRSVAGANSGSGVRINAICPSVVDTGIVPDAFRDPETIMSPAEIAEDIVDLLLHGTNGEIRAKVSGRAAFIVPPVELSGIEAPTLGVAG